MTFEEMIRETLHFGNPETRKLYAEENANAPVIMDLDYCDTLKQKMQDFLGGDYTVNNVGFSEDGYSYKRWYYDISLSENYREKRYIRFILTPDGVFMLNGDPTEFRIRIQDKFDEILNMIKK